MSIGDTLVLERSWMCFKTIWTQKTLSVYCVECPSFYHIRAEHGPFILSCLIEKSTPKGVDQIDFEDNYMSGTL